MGWDEWVRTLGSGGTLLVVVVAVTQLYLNRQQTKANFEDDLSREYRNITAQLPGDAFFGDADPDAPLTDPELQAMFRYFDLSNEQLRFGAQRRVSKATRKAWEEGMEQNLKLPRFQRAWEDVTSRLQDDYFTELYKLKRPARQKGVDAIQPSGGHGPPGLGAASEEALNPSEKSGAPHLVEHPEVRGSERTY